MPKPSCRPAMTSSLPLPQSLRSLIETGAWPLTEEDLVHQNLSGGWVDGETVRRLVRDEGQIYFYPPPFRTIAQQLETAERAFWNEHGDLPRIDPARALLLGDFGIGSESAIALDYRDPGEPPLIRLRWEHSGSGPRWVPFFPSFADFDRAFSLASRRRR